MVSATSKAHTVAIATTTAPTAMDADASGRTRITAVETNTAAGLSTGCGQMGAWRAHSRIRSAAAGVATA